MSLEVLTKHTQDKLDALRKENGLLNSLLEKRESEVFVEYQKLYMENLKLKKKIDMIHEYTKTFVDEMGID